MRYAIARFNQNQRDFAYRIYVSDSIRILTENTAKLVSGNYVTIRFVDMIKQKNSENKTGEEIFAEVVGKAGIEVTW